MLKISIMFFGLFIFTACATEENTESQLNQTEIEPFQVAYTVVGNPYEFEFCNYSGSDIDIHIEGRYQNIRRNSCFTNRSQSNSIYLSYNYGNNTVSYQMEDNNGDNWAQIIFYSNVAYYVDAKTTIVGHPAAGSNGNFTGSTPNIVDYTQQGHETYKNEAVEQEVDDNWQCKLLDDSDDCGKIDVDIVIP